MCKNIANLREHTVDAEIKRKGHFQRVREGESRAERCFANGPQRAWGKRRAQVFHDVGHTLVAGNMLVFRESVETQSKVAPRVMRIHPALDRSVIGLSSAGFLMYKSSFGAKANGPLADQGAFAPETTTRMSMKFREGGTRMRILVSDTRVAESNGAARWTYTLPRRSSFGAKANGPLADQGAFAPETTTRMSMKFREGGTRMSRRQNQ